MRKISAWLLLALLTGLAGKNRLQAQMPDVTAHWVSVWGTAVFEPMHFPGMPAAPALTETTIRMIVRPTAGGAKLRVRLSNAFGKTPLRIGAATIAVSDEGAKIKSGSSRVLTFGGRPEVVIPPGAPVVSDVVNFQTAPLESLAVSIYLPNGSPVSTWHELAKHDSYLAGPGDQTAKADLPNAEKRRAWFFLAELDAWVPANVTTTVAFGDSITDGDGDRAHSEKNWPDQLAERLVAIHTGAPIAVVNEGISGNRVLHDAAGVSALMRLDSDLLSQPGVKNLIVLEGINDIGFPRVRFDLSKMPKGFKMPDLASEKVSAAEIVQGLQQIVVRAHEHGIRVFGATLTPFEGTNSYDAEGEAIRQEVNRWIRTSGVYDGVIDFDALVRDPEHPTRIRKEYDSGDHIHPSPDGYKAMADAIPVEKLRGK